jgi:cytochrome c biogenesis protein CcmG, thiol:disulfide interchange protein DsbE
MSGKKARHARQAEWRTIGRGGRPLNRRWLWIGASALVVGALIGGVLAARGKDGNASFSRAESGGSQLNLDGRSPITSQNVDLAAYQGKPVVLNIWASWCTGCRAEARDLAAFEGAHPEAQVIGLDTQDNDGDARAFYRQFGWSHPSIRDPGGRTAAKLGLQGLPTTIFLDAQHREVTRIIGATNRAGFEQGLRAAKNPA